MKTGLFRAIPLMTEVDSNTAPPFVACLGPEGSFSHLLTQNRFPDASIRALASVGEVFDLLQQDPRGLGVVPIENSSGGFILDTVDRLIDPRHELAILEELTLDVKLAFLGHEGQAVEVIYSHPMPFFHADEWLKKHHPEARRVTKSSTSAAAELAAADPAAATIGPRQNADRAGLDLLHYPIAGEIPNITQFYLLGRAGRSVDGTPNRSAWVVDLADRPGSLCQFLTPFSERGINLKRLESRPIRGQPNQYRFYVELAGTEDEPAVQDALSQARAAEAVMRCLGAYPSGRVFES